MNFGCNDITVVIFLTVVSVTGRDFNRALLRDCVPNRPGYVYNHQSLFAMLTENIYYK